MGSLRKKVMSGVGTAALAAAAVGSVGLAVRSIGDAYVVSSSLRCVVWV